MYLVEPSRDQISELMEVINAQEDTIRYVSLYPLPITEADILPKAPNPLVAQLTPPQSYLSFAGSGHLAQGDVSTEVAALLSEVDTDH